MRRVTTMISSKYIWLRCLIVILKARCPSEIHNSLPSFDEVNVDDRCHTRSKVSSRINRFQLDQFDIAIDEENDNNAL
jgi:hypothetical protein